MTAIQPAGEHHAGTLDLTGEGNRAEVASPISDVAVEAATLRISELGRKYFGPDADAPHIARMYATAALEAAHPAIRQQVAEEIAVAIEARRDPDFDTVVNRNVFVRNLAKMARGIGGQGLDAISAPSGLGPSLTAGVNTDPSDPPASQAVSKRLPGGEG